MDFAPLLGPSPASAKFVHPDFYIWCGSPIEGPDGRWHLFYSRWPRALGHYAWVTHSEIARATAPGPLGPWTHAEVTLPARGAGFWDGLCTHNPTVRRFGDRYYLYYMGNTGDGRALPDLNWTHRNNQRVGVAVASDPAGPWQRFETPLIAPTPGFIDSLMASNPSVTQRATGDFLIIYKAVDQKRPLPFGGPVLHAAALAPTPMGPFTKQPAPVFAADGVAFPAEDPFIWRAADRYWAIVKDLGGYFTRAGKSLALFTSTDGLAWRVADHPLVATTRYRTTDGQEHPLLSLERPQLAFARDGRPLALLCAADVDERRDHSFNVGLPIVGEASAFFEAAH
jgi:hypothetical protein